MNWRYSKQLGLIVLGLVLAGCNDSSSDTPSTPPPPQVVDTEEGINEPLLDGTIAEDEKVTVILPEGIDSFVISQGTVAPDDEGNSVFVVSGFLTITKPD